MMQTNPETPAETRILSPREKRGPGQERGRVEVGGEEGEQRKREALGKSLMILEETGRRS